MKIKIDGTLLQAIRLGMFLSVNEIITTVRNPVNARTWQKYETGELKIPEIVAEDMYYLCTDFTEFKKDHSNKDIVFSKKFEDFTPDLNYSLDSAIQFKFHQAAFCQCITEIYSADVEEMAKQSGKLN